MDSRKQPITAWHSLHVSEVAEQLDASEGGLSEDAAAARLAEFGPNKLPQKPPTPLWAIVLQQFRSPLIYILALAAGVSLAIGDVKDAAFIVGVLVLNAVIGTLPWHFQLAFSQQALARFAGSSRHLQQHRTTT